MTLNMAGSLETAFEACKKPYSNELEYTAQAQAAATAVEDWLRENPNEVHQQVAVTNWPPSFPGQAANDITNGLALVIVASKAGYTTAADKLLASKDVVKFEGMKRQEDSSKSTGVAAKARDALARKVVKYERLLWLLEAKPN